MVIWKNNHLKMKMKMKMKMVDVLALVSGKAFDCHR